MIKFYSSLILFILALTSCSKSYKVTGVSSVSSLDGKMLYLKTSHNGQWVTVDSAEVIHGEFSMKGSLDSVQLVSLFMDDENIMPMVLEGGNIEISISNTKLTVKGTPLNDKLYAFVDKKASMDTRVEELGRKEAKMILDGVDPEVIKKQMAKESDKLMTEMNAYVKSFICENYENVLGPGVFMMMCSNFPYPLMTPAMEDIVKSSPNCFKNNPLIKEYVTKAHENMQSIQEYQIMQHNAEQQASMVSRPAASAN
ncbi:DUF4369 domain-containing protein [Bacteroides sedimenti]|uniref:Thiol:disulfide interchange protein n=1 Tax=Bacteroides sedimenti TaxID=2136147 RepID=A0ABM8IA48_9BACE